MAAAERGSLQEPKLGAPAQSLKSLHDSSNCHEVKVQRINANLTSGVAGFATTLTL